MSHDQIILDLDAVEERFHLFNKKFPQEHLEEFYKFNPKISAKENLSLLSEAILNDQHSSNYLFAYKPIFLAIMSHWTLQSNNGALLLKILNTSAKIVTMYPLSMSIIEDFLAQYNEHFITILQNPSTQEDSHIFQIVLSYYRFLFHNKEVFIKFIEPDVLYSIVESEFTSPLTKFISLKLLGIYLQLNESGTMDMVKKYLDINNTELFCSSDETRSNVNYKFLELNEAKRFSNFTVLPEVDECFDKDIKSIKHYFTIESSDLNDKVVSIGGVIVPRVHITTETENKYATSLVPTVKTISTIRQLAKILQKTEPVMLLGKAGAGKTFLINELSKYIGCHDSIVKIHLGEQTDAKLLIGTYTSGEKPGTFEWRAGVLTTAVKEGRWVLIEDIDKAPTEVLSILLSLLEKRELTIPSRGETIKAGNGFQLISTVRLTEDMMKQGTAEDFNLNMIGMRIWNTVLLDEPSEEDLNLILTNRYPVLTHLIPKLIHSYKAVKRIYLDPRFISLNKGAHSRVVSVRDLVKLCNRLDTLFQNNNITKPDQLIESSIYDSIFAEATDCFAGAISEFKALEPLIHSIGESLEIANSRISLFLTKHVPQFQNFDDYLTIGRAKLHKSTLSLQKKSLNSTSFALTNHSLRLMEQISVAIQMTEPVLLVGETGTGKTTVVQQVAKMMNKSLTVINVSQQTETGDLLGGYKPVNSKSVAVPIQEEFELLFAGTFSIKKNERFYKMLHKCFNKSQWKNVVKLWKEAYKMAQTILKKEDKMSEAEDDGRKKKRKLNTHQKELLLNQWAEFDTSVDKFKAQSSSLENSFVFNFVEGSLVKAVRTGEWLLLDEVNLASADTLESISDLLSDVSSRSVLLSEKGDAEPIKAHPDFRIFACMNPATDVGKRDLPTGIRSRFTEIYVHSPDRDITDLLSIIDKYIGSYSVSDEWVGNDIAELYLEAKRLSDNNQIVDGSNQKPHFSIRTLTRTLLYVCDIVKIYGLRRSLYDGFCMAFLTLLDQKSAKLLEPIIAKFTIDRLKNAKSVLLKAPASPGPDYVQFKHYWMRKGQEEVQEQPHYIITPFVEKNMLNLVRATSGNRFPILVQGPTSAGKTSMVKYLADITGHKFVRINNHEHTDLQEYLGTYVTDDTGKLAFKEGVLVEALRKGYWIVLDELNLAPTDVLEALNRLLDDNRELFIPETQEVVHPHPDFMLFATQNPPGIYGGRKILSRAFRNRFLELHFDDIPQDELEIILRERCQIAPSYAKKIVEVYRQLSIERSANRLFEQKNSFATLRDLFRWAMRDAVGYEELAANGYMLLAERCRTPQEKVTVKKALEKVMKVQLNMDNYYTKLEDPNLQQLQSVVWTKALRRLAVLVTSCLKNNEPVLLVGETGCGKTTICQLLSEFTGKELITLNAHQNTETGDILGAQRPLRNRSELQHQLIVLLQEALNDTTEADLDHLLSVYDNSDKTQLTEEQIHAIKKIRDNLGILFEWNDGPLIQALKEGNFFLFDEISLADDSVLERLNSVLEPERSLLLAEKGSADNFVTAKEGFQFFATMNPGGDYGKKELSPALRNRFTEIWVPSMENFEDVSLIVESRLQPNLKDLTESIVGFSEWFGKKYGGGDATNGIISLRDILAWVEFINSTSDKLNSQAAPLVHGALMVFVDALGTNNTAYLAENEENLRKQKRDCINILSKIFGCDLLDYVNDDNRFNLTNENLNIGIFSYPRASSEVNSNSFNIDAPTTAANLMRVIRAMQVRKPILLEGSPGVGKTSLITALAELTGNELTRINLSEQTDLIDLFGSDAPGERSGEFVWHDAPFLRAMQQGHWVLLDEMNLASQSVLEGLNACLDHRGEAYIPELDKSFTRHPNFVVFAAQNPQYQGGGRKGLPKSFVNRFSVVYVDMLTANDLLLIAQHLYPQVDSETIKNVIHLISELEEEVSRKKQWGISGSPWEFNLRDALRWLKLLGKKGITDDMTIYDFFDIIIKQRFRTKDDRGKASALLHDIFGSNHRRADYFGFGNDFVQFNNAVAKRNPHYSYPLGEELYPLECNFEFYESAVRCVSNNWPLILVGPSNSGKTDLVRYLAAVLGSEVDIFSMNSDVDSMDILGGYEQVDITRKIASLVENLKSCLKDILYTNMNADSVSTEPIVLGLRLLNSISKQSVNSQTFEAFYGSFKNFHSFVQSNPTLNKIEEQVERMESLIKKQEAAKFEWFDGMLVKAVEEGRWLILDNANLCSPSVLDRLNSLLETDGSLLINECSQENGEPRVLIPHPNFRLFLTMDPKYGELSRAMRNRGIEIFLDKLEIRSTSFDKDCLKCLNNVTMSEDGTLSENLESLTIHRFNKPKPLKCFIEPKCSNMEAFANIHDVILYSSDDIPIEPLSCLVPFDKINEIESWYNNISHSVHYYDGEYISKVVNLFKYSQTNEILEQLNTLSLQSERNFLQIIGKDNNKVSYQQIMVLLNEFLIPELQKHTKYIASSENVYLFSLLYQLGDLYSRLSIINKRSTLAKVSDLSYIEKSAAIANGRQLKENIRIPVFILLNDICSYISQAIISKPLFTIDGMFKSLWSLMVISVSIFDSASRKDEARLRVYKEVLEQWNLSATQLMDTSDFTKICEKFDSSMDSKRGLSMTTIWEKFRVTYPQSSETWELWNNLQILCSKFDEVKIQQFEESNSSIVTITVLFAELMGDILSNNTSGFDELAEKLKEGIDGLEALSSNFLNKRKHFFANEFNILLRILSLYQDSLTPLLQKIAPNVDISTNKLIKLTSSDQVYPAVLDLLWTENDGRYESHTPEIITSKFIGDIIKKTNQFNKFSGSHIDQTLSDAKLLLTATIESSDYLLKNSVSELSSRLLGWIKIILSSHLDCDISSLKSETLTLLLSNDRNKHLKDVYETYLREVIDILTNTTNEEELGQAWILFGIALLILYAPDIPYDPAVHDYVLYDIFEKHVNYSKKMLNAWATVGMVTSGDERLLVEQLVQTPSEDEMPKKPRVYRSTVSVDNLIDEWSAFFTSTINPEHSSGLFKSVDKWDTLLEGKYEMFQQNSSNFLRRLNTGYEHFSDLNDIFAGYVFSIKLGFDLMKYNIQEKDKDVNLSSLWAIDSLQLTNRNNLVKAFDELSKLTKTTSVDSFSSEKIMIFFVELFKYHNCDKELVGIFDNALQTLYYRWSLRRMKNEQKALEESSIFKYEDKSEDIEAEFQQMFPDYDNALSLDDTSSTATQGDEDLDDVYHQIAITYMSLFSEKEHSSIADLVKSGSKIVDVLTKDTKRLISGEISSSLLMTSITHLYDEINTYNTLSDSENLDFYRDSYVVESKKAVSIITNIWLKVHSLLQQWPEHATLHELYRICQEFLSFSADTPLARQLQKIEQIYTFMTEWEKYAASHVSLSSYITEITNLIVSWRRLELHTWKGLFNTEDKKIEKSIGKWWFYLFETIITTNNELKKGETSQLTTLLSSLNVFFSKSTIGEFEIRLKLVKTFACHLKQLMPHYSETLDALNNIISFYGQFSNIIREFITKGRKSLEKDISEVILLASWKDVNIDALKQSSRKSHNSLYKLVRKYRSILSTAVLSIIENGLTYDHKLKLHYIQFNKAPFNELDLTEAKQIVETIPGWDTRIKALKNVDLVKRNMEVYYSKVNSQEFPNFEELVRDYAREADRLRDETPNVYKKEIKKTLAALKVQKTKLLSDALKEFRRIGLKTSFREDIHNVQGTATAILANSPSFVGTVMEGSDEYFFRMLDILPKLRSAVASPAEDLPVASVERGMAIMENLIFSLITTRKPLLKLSRNYAEFTEIYEYLQAICSSTGNIKHSSLQINVRNLRYITTWLPKIIDYALKTLSVIELSTEASLDTSLLFQTSTGLRELNSRVQSVSVFDSNVSVLISDYQNFITHFINQLESGKNSNNFFVYDNIIEWIKQNTESSVKIENISEPVIDEIDQRFRKVFTSIILAFQKLMENDYSSVGEEEDSWLSTKSKSTITHIRGLNVSTVVKNLQSVVTLLQHSDISSTTSVMLRAVTAFTLPVINNYFMTIRTILEKSRLYYVDLSQGTYILANILHNLANNGFCSPEPPSEEVDDNNLHEGTGLGDGEGAQNNSKDVEQNEDLTEDAQTENQDQKNKDDREDDEEEDDAVEMEGDMAGEMENISDQEDKDDDEMDEEEENDLDDQIDDLDEDDPNAVDDKMWDEEAADDSKEKETDKTLDSKDENDVEAGDDQDDNADNGENEGQNAEEEDESNEEIKNEEQDDNTNEDNTNNEGDEMEEDENAEEEEDVGEQDDEVRNNEGEEMDANVPEVETMELPDDMKLDSGDEDEDEEEEDGEMKDDLDMKSEDEEEEEMKPDNVDNAVEDEQDNMDVDEDAIEDETMQDVGDEDNQSGEEEGNQDDEHVAENGEEEEEEELGQDQDQMNDENTELGGDDNAEGLDGVEDLLEEEAADADAAVQQQFGSKGTGSDSKDTEEQEDIGSSGNTQNAHQAEQEQEQDDNVENSREEAKQALKQLGDSLKEFHRRRREIKEASERAEEEDGANNNANERPDDFEHVDGANTETDTQALGSANQDEIQTIDEDKAIDDDIEDQEENMEGDNEGAEDHDMFQDENGVQDDDELNEDANEKQDENGEAQEGKVGGVFTNQNDEDDPFNNDKFRNDQNGEENNYENEIDMILDEVDDQVNKENSMDKPSRDLDESRTIWRKSEIATAELASRLGEQLRLILEPTLATKLRGDYKTGKRLNMKRIIPYIASQFRKDKIWLRRTKPSKRDYQIMIALDNSKSMSESNCVKLAFDSLCLVSRTLTQLESGGLSIMKFGEHSREVHSFDQQFSNDAGAKTFQWFDFQDTKTDVKKLVAESIKIFERGRGMTSNSDQWQLEIIISDGICEDHETLQRLVRRARENKIMLVFVIIDGITSKESIMDMNQVNYVPDQYGNPQLKINKYLDTFPFEFYVVVHDITELPEMLSIILRQYFSDLASS